MNSNVHIVQCVTPLDSRGEAGRWGRFMRRSRNNTTGNFERLRDLALPFFPLKSALPTLSGRCGEIWTRNLPNVTLVAQTAPFGTLVGKTREKAQSRIWFQLWLDWHAVLFACLQKGSIWYARDMSNCDYGFQRTPPCSSFARLSHQESQIWRASQIFMVMKVLASIMKERS